MYVQLNLSGRDEIIDSLAATDDSDSSLVVFSLALGTTSTVGGIGRPGAEAVVL